MCAILLLGWATYGILRVYANYDTRVGAPRARSALCVERTAEVGNAVGAPTSVYCVPVTRPGGPYP